MRTPLNSILLVILATGFPLTARAQCWPVGRDLTSVELTACFMAEYQRCEEQVPTFRSQAGSKINKLKSNPKFQTIFKSKDYERTRLEAYKNLVAGQPISDGCRNMLATLERGEF
jgi:hypothetical protein